MKHLPYFDKFPKYAVCPKTEFLRPLFCTRGTHLRLRPRIVFSIQNLTPLAGVPRPQKECTLQILDQRALARLGCALIVNQMSKSVSYATILYIDIKTR